MVEEKGIMGKQSALLQGHDLNQGHNRIILLEMGDVWEKSEHS